MQVEESLSTNTVTRDEVEILAASAQELPRRAGLALKALLEDLAKAQAAAASTAINTGNCAFLIWFVPADLGEHSIHIHQIIFKGCNFFMGMSGLFVFAKFFCELVLLSLAPAKYEGFFLVHRAKIPSTRARHRFSSV